MNVLTKIKGNYKNCYIQVDKSHYFNIEYDSKGRFCSYWHQINEIITKLAEVDKDNAIYRNVLEVGIGNSFVSEYLRKRGIKVLTIDIDKSLNPDYIGSVTDLPFDDSSFELIACYEVLEHLPFDDFSLALNEMRRVTKKLVIISLPNSSPCLRFQFEIPKICRIKILIPIPYPLRVHKFDGQHY